MLEIFFYKEILTEWSNLKNEAHLFNPYSSLLLFIVERKCCFQKRIKVPLKHLPWSVFTIKNR